MKLLNNLIVAVTVSVLPLSAHAHEAWLEPTIYRIASENGIAAELRNGEKFSGIRYPYNKRSFVRFDAIHDGETSAIEGRLGDRPAAKIADAAEGLHVLVYQSAPQKLTYRKWDKFKDFAEHKDLADAAVRHAKRGLPETGFVESYVRFIKALIAVGEGRGEDAPTGMLTELVALDNPYIGTPEQIRVQALYRGEPRADAQIEMFEKAPDGVSVDITLHRTDARGIAVLPVKAGYSYLVDAVILREPGKELAPADEAVWETLWAALTFAVE